MLFMKEGSMNQTFDIELMDLREVRDEGLLNFVYRNLYLPNFPIHEEQEDPSVWRPLLWGPLRNQLNPVLHILVAGHFLRTKELRKVVGALFAEFYKESKCGLLTYLVVHPNHRHQGIGKYLLQEGIQRLKTDAKKSGAKLQAVFGEVNNPSKVSVSQDSMNPEERLRIIAKLGARLIPIRYVQPELRPGQGRSGYMFFVVFPLHERQEEYVSGNIVVVFLREFYQVQGVVDRDNDRDLLHVVTYIENKDIKLKELKLNKLNLGSGIDNKVFDPA